VGLCYTGFKQDHAAFIAGEFARAQGSAQPTLGGWRGGWRKMLGIDCWGICEKEGQHNAGKWHSAGCSSPCRGVFRVMGKLTACPAIR